MPIATVNPANGETLRTFDALDEEETERRLAAAHRAFRQYRTTDFAERARLLNRAADLLDEDQQDIARTMTTEMGKPVKAARAEAAKCAKAMRWYAANAERLLADEHPDDADVKDSGASRARVHYRPLGVVLAVMPWNFPLWQVMRFAAPALMAGNAGLLKHASNVPQTALYLEDLFHQGRVPRRLLPDAAHRLGRRRGHPARPPGRRGDAHRQRTGGPRGRLGRRRRGEEDRAGTRRQRPVTSSCPRRTSSKAAKTAVTARVQNNGQSCIAAKRFIVHTDVYDAFAERFTAGMRALTVGDPMEESTDVGPLSSEQGRTDLEELVDDALGEGATALCGGRAARRSGPWLVLRAHRAHGDHPGHAHPPRGDLRPGRHALPGGRPRRGRGSRQRHALRAQFQRLDARPGGDGPLRPRPGGRRRVLQRHDGLPPGAARSAG